MISTSAILYALFLSVSTLVAPATAANVCPYTSRSCAGNFGCCTNIPATTCCTWPSNYGWSVMYQDMPSTPWYAYRYGDQCNTITGGGNTDGSSICLSVYNAPSYLASVAGNWVVYSNGRRSAEPPNTTNTSECILPDVIGYVTEDGSTRLVKVPAGRFEEISNYVDDNNTEELLKLEEYTASLDV